MNKIIKYLADNFDEVSEEEIKDFVNNECSGDDCIDFANLIVLLNETSDEIKDYIFSKMN